MAVALTTGMVCDSIQDRDGYPFLSEPVKVYVLGTEIPQPVFIDEDLSQVIPSVSTDDDGDLTFYAPVGRVTIEVRGVRKDIPVHPISVVRDATSTVKGIVRLAGALSGSADSPTVPGLEAKYTLPSGGVPETQMAVGVRTALDLARSALQTAPVTSVNNQTGAVTISGTVSDATDSAKGVVQLTNHLGGTASAPTVPGLASKVNTSTFNAEVSRATNAEAALQDLINALKVGTNAALLNVKNAPYNAQGDGSTDDTDAIQQALTDALPGQTVFFPLGVFLVKQTLLFKKGQVVQGCYAPWWAYNTGFFCSIVPATAFTGNSLIRIQDSTFSGTTADPHGCRISNIGLDGKTRGTGLHGIEVEGYVTDFRTAQVNIRNFSGVGMYLHPRVTSNVAYFQKGLNFVDTVVESCDGKANWVIEDVTDSAWENCHSHFPTGDAWLISGSGDNHFHGLRNTFGKQNGIHTIVSPNGRPWTGAVFTNVSTDRQEKYGVLLQHTGSRPTVFTGLFVRRDGANANAGGGNYAGVGLIGTSTNKVGPIVITGLAMSTGQDDSNAGTPSPQYAVALSYARSLTLGDSLLYSNDDADVIYDMGNNDDLRLGKLMVQTGAPSTSVNYKPAVKAVTTDYSAKSFESTVVVTTGGSAKTVKLPRPYNGMEKCVIGDGTINVLSDFANVGSGSSTQFSNGARRFVADGTKWLVGA